MDYSFGIFLGYDLTISETESKLSNSEFRDTIRKRIKEEIISTISSFNFQIKKNEFSSYKFYIYVIPFSNLAKIRKEIIKEITT